MPQLRRTLGGNIACRRRSASISCRMTCSETDCSGYGGSPPYGGAGPSTVLLDERQQDQVDSHPLHEPMPSDDAAVVTVVRVAHPRDVHLDCEQPLFPATSIQAILVQCEHPSDVAPGGEHWHHLQQVLTSPSWQDACPTSAAVSTSHSHRSPDHRDYGRMPVSVIRTWRIQSS
jgi:hypothetical protein